MTCNRAVTHVFHSRWAHDLEIENMALWRSLLAKLMFPEEQAFGFLRPTRRANNQPASANVPRGGLIENCFRAAGCDILKTLF
jgi:hypothetical protein